VAHRCQRLRNALERRSLVHSSASLYYLWRLGMIPRNPTNFDHYTERSSDH
jgi:hypothetical protein